MCTLEFLETIKEYPKYDISNLGRVYNNKKKNFCNLHIHGGYFISELCANSVPKRCYVHKLVAEYFIPNPDKKKFVTHIDGNLHNNKQENLKWVNRKNCNNKGGRKGHIIILQKDTDNNIIQQFQGIQKCAEYLGKSYRTVTRIIQREKLYDGFYYSRLSRKCIDITGEKWKVIKNSNYSVSDYGRVKNNNTNKHMKNQKNTHGYLITRIRINTKQITYSTHRLVAKYFIPNPNNKPCINHIDGCKTNNTMSNLEWVTHKENVKHAFATGLSARKGRRVKQLDFLGNTIAEYNSMVEAGKAVDAPRSSINRVCIGHRYKCRGFKWEYC